MKKDYILGIRKKITEYPELMDILSLFEGIQEMLDNPLSFWDSRTLNDLSEKSKLIEGDKNFHKFLNHFNKLERVVKHPLSFYLLGDSKSFFFADGEEKKGTSYFSTYTSKQNRKDVAGLLPADSEGEGLTRYEIPYLYDINDINEGLRLLPIPSSQIISVLGKNYFLDFLLKLKLMLGYFTKNPETGAAGQQLRR